MNDAPLIASLQGCSLHALVILTTKLFSRLGLGDVEIMDRRLPGQKTRHGGYELLCRANLGEFPVKVVVKVIRDDIRLRMLDELSGVVYRTRADFGIIVSPFFLSTRSGRTLGALRSKRLEVIDGKRLAAMLTKAGLGVRTTEPDYAFFGGLEEASEKVAAFLATTL